MNAHGATGASTPSTGVPRTPARFGLVRGLAQCASPTGRFAILALDHRQNLRRALRPDDPLAVTPGEFVAFKRDVLRAVAPAATAVLLDPELGLPAAIADGSLPGHAGLLASLEATGYDATGAGRRNRLIAGWSPFKARLTGAAAAKLLVYYHPDAPNAAVQERFVERAAAASMRAGLPLFVEPLSYPLDGRAGGLTGEERRRVVVATARRLTRLGLTILKAEFPYDPSVTDDARWRAACEEVTEASAVPWVLLSGGVDADVFEGQTEVACRAGASGIVAGRAVWGEATGRPPDQRVAWLTTVARPRFERLAAIVERVARPWPAAPGAPQVAAPDAEDWFR